MIRITISPAAFDRIVVRLPVLGDKAALAHAVGDETEQAYRRGDALEKRRELMTAWADWLEGNAAAKVVPIGSLQKQR
jgi:hypothetical protein